MSNTRIIENRLQVGSAYTLVSFSQNSSSIVLLFGTLIFPAQILVFERLWGFSVEKQSEDIENMCESIQTMIRNVVYRRLYSL